VEHSAVILCAFSATNLFLLSLPLSRNTRARARARAPFTNKRTTIEDSLKICTFFDIRNSRDDFGKKRKIMKCASQTYTHLLLRKDGIS